MNHSYESLLSSILTQSDGTRFYRLSNADGKIWAMPARNMSVGMCIYQPSSLRGKAVKLLFPYLHRIGVVRRVVNAETAYYKLRDDICSLLCKLFDVYDFEFSVFGGTPCVHQKITIQISRGRHILGYCKVSDNEQISLLFRREADTLKTLCSKGITDIPQCLFLGKLQDGLYVFVQSTKKTCRSNIIHKWSFLHEEFLHDMNEKTVQKLSFEATDYYRTLIELKCHLDYISEKKYRSIVDKAIDNVLSEYEGRNVEFSAYHADFTPWNMFEEQGELFVFDFEYARLTYPPMLDKYHFFSQTAIFEQHWSADDIIEYGKSDKGAWMDNKLYVLYILDVMSRFAIRDKGVMSNDILQSFAVWSALLKELT